MKRVTVYIEKTGQTLNYDYDNFVTRDEVEHEAYSKNIHLRQMREDKEIKSSDFYITWHELNVNGEIEVAPAPVTKAEPTPTVDELIETVVAPKESKTAK